MRFYAVCIKGIQHTHEAASTEAGHGHFGSSVNAASPWPEPVDGRVSGGGLTLRLDWIHNKQVRAHRQGLVLTARLVLWRCTGPHSSHCGPPQSSAAPVGSSGADVPLLRGYG